MTPIHQAEMSYEDMQKLAADHVCGQCGGLVGVAWDAEANHYIIRCANLGHSTLTRHDAAEEKQIQEIRRVQKLDSKSLMTMPEAKMIERVGMAKFPQDLTKEEQRMLAQVAITYGFDPLMGEVTIYQGRPWVSIDGRYRKAQETGELDGVETRPANKQERADWDIPEGDYFFRSEVYRKGAAHPFVGWGRVRKAETLGGKGFKPVETNPQRMAEKRAEGQGLRKGFHIPLPSIEDIGTPEAESAEVIVTVESPKQIRSDPAGEKQKAAPKAAAKESHVKPVEDWNKITAVKNYLDLLPIVHDLAGLQPKDLYKELGGTCMADMTISAWDAFVTIKERYYPKAPAEA